MFIETLADYLAENSIIPAVGSSVNGTYLNFLPIDPDIVTSLHQYNMRLPNAPVKIYAVYHIQLITRDTTQIEAMARAYEVYNFLKLMIEKQDYEDTWFVFRVGNGPLGPFRDSKDRPYYTFNFSVTSSS